MCGPLKGCEEVARSEYSRIAGIPVAVFGVGLSLILLTFALAWWRTNFRWLLLAHYGLSLAVLGLAAVWSSRVAWLKGWAMALYGVGVLAGWRTVESPAPVATALGAIVGLFLVAAAMGFGLWVSVLRGESERRK